MKINSNLSCKKRNDEYVVRLEFGDDVLEMELTKMAKHLVQHLKAENTK
jgi:hypothetical protein